MVLTFEGELMISGKLPFESSELYQFEQLAKFEAAVQVKQIESSQFTTILAKLPGEDRQELFLWGLTPLGVFQEPVSLNQLINETQPGDQQHQFDISAV